jgi:pyruvate dehydrogenase E2 component (dihydrolipoamide acetyltransferase)
MATKIIMPKLGNTVESSVILSWKVKPGDRIAKDSVLCEIETDKATMDVPAGVEGTVLALLRKVGDDVPVLEPIAVIGEPGEVWQQGPEAGRTSPAGETRAAQAAAAPDAARTGPSSETKAGAPTTSPEASKISEAAPAPSLAGGVDKHASPRARQAMSRLGVSVGAVTQGSGPGGRILERDVVAASLEATAPRAAEARPPQETVQAIAGAAQEFETVPLIGVRKRIAARMFNSIQTTAQYTEHCTADAERLLALRARFKAQKNPDIAGITIGDLVLAATIKVLPEFPEFNAHLVEGALQLYRPVHLGVAVDTPRGLMVPVVKNAQALPLTGLSKEVKRLAQACQNGSASPDSLSGSTFTVTNLGAYGIDQFTPVINAPETAILGVCTVRPTLVQTDKGIETRMRIGLSLTSDHQVIDGAYAARFLKRLVEVIADIDFLFMSF